jgi:hypothetical protein
MASVDSHLSQSVCWCPLLFGSFAFFFRLESSVCALRVFALFAAKSVSQQSKALHHSDISTQRTEPGEQTQERRKGTKMKDRRRCNADTLLSESDECVVVHFPEIAKKKVLFEFHFPQLESERDMANAICFLITVRVLLVLLIL